MNQKTFSQEDTNKMTYDEFGKIIDDLVSKIESSGIKFEAVAPILRSGAIQGMMLAIKLKIFKVIPLGLKSNYETGEIDELFTVPEVELRGNSNILICENNTYSGHTATKAIALLQRKYPKATLYYATIAKVYGGPESFDGIKDYFYGVKTNEMFKADQLESVRLNLRPNITIFPWENTEDELKDINATL